MSVRVAMFAPHFPPAYLGGGPIRTLSAMVEQASPTVTFAILTSDRDHTCTERLPVTRNRSVQHGRHDLRYVSTDKPWAWWRALSWLRSKKPDVVYVNGYFHPTMSVLPRVLAKLGFWGPSALLCIAPRGELDPGAIQIKAVKKRSFLRVAKLLNLDRRIIWHASSAREATNIRASIGNDAWVVVRENETELPPRAVLPEPRPEGPLRLVFVSRLSPKKGLHSLLAVLPEVGRPVVLDVYGGWDDTEYEDLCRGLLAPLRGDVSVTFHGPVAPEEVRSAFAAADAFVFPTAAENFGHVIAESLSSSCPVALADVTPWSELVSRGAGILVEDVGPSGWVSAIQRLADMEPEDRRRLREQTAALYEEWRQKSQGPSIFELVMAASQSEESPTP